MHGQVIFMHNKSNTSEWVLCDIVFQENFINEKMNNNNHYHFIEVSLFWKTKYFML